MIGIIAAEHICFVNITLLCNASGVMLEALGMLRASSHNLIPFFKFIRDAISVFDVPQPQKLHLWEDVDVRCCAKKYQNCKKYTQHRVPESWEMFMFVLAKKTPNNTMVPKSPIVLKALINDQEPLTSKAGTTQICYSTAFSVGFFETRKQQNLTWLRCYISCCLEVFCISQMP